MSVSLVVFSVIVLPLLSVKVFRLIHAAHYRPAAQLSGMSLPLLVAVYWPYSSGIQGLLELQIAMWMCNPPRN